MGEQEVAPAFGRVFGRKFRFDLLEQFSRAFLRECGACQHVADAAMGNLHSERKLLRCRER